MAGTTVREGGAVYRGLRETLAAHGLQVSAEQVERVKGMDKREALRVLIAASSFRDQLGAHVDVIHREFVARLMAAYRADRSVSEIPGASATFRRLHEHGILTALDTGFSRDIAQDLIDRLGWERDGLIDTSVTSDEVEHGRPQPFMIHEVMRRLGVTDPRQVVKVGDTPVDVLEGRNAGCGLVVGVTAASGSRASLAAAAPDHLIDSVADLPALLGL